MAQSPIFTVYTSDGKSLAGPVALEDKDASGLTGSYVEEFEHCVYVILKDYLYALLYGVDFIRRHKPMTIIKQIDKMSIPLMKSMISGTFLPKIELRWLQHDEKSGKTTEYFRMTLEHVRFHHIEYIMPDVKDPAFERYGHLEKIQLIFQKITWLYTKGYLTYTDIWNEAFGEFDRKDFEQKEEETGEDLAETPMVEKLTITFTSGKFEEPKDGFDFDKKVTVKFTYTASRKPDNKENKVYVKLYAEYNGKTEGLHLTNEGRLVNDDNWSTEFKLKKPEAYKKESGSVEYYAEIENAYAGGNYKSESISLGSTGITMQSMAWKNPAARRDETVSLAAEFTDCKDEEKAIVEIYEFDRDGKHDFMEKIESSVSGGKLEAEWKFVYQEDTDDIMTEEETQKTGGKYNPPEYFFTVEIAGQKWGDKQESGLLEFKDWIEVELQDETGNACANEPFELHLPDGSTQNGTLDENGFARVESIPPGPVEVVFTNYPSVTIKK